MRPTTTHSNYKPYTIEYSNSHLGKSPSFENKNSIFNPRGLHLVAYLKPKNIRGFSNLKLDQIFHNNFKADRIGEGFSIQYCLNPIANSFQSQINLRLIASAHNYYQASEILDSLYSLFKKDFRKINYDKNSDGLADYAYQNFHEKHSFVLTSDQLTNLLPASLVAQNNPLVAELKKIIKGEVLEDENSLEHYATDGSVFKVKPWAIVLPKNKSDLVNLVKWVSKQKFEIPSLDSPESRRGGRNSKFEIDKLSITCRGKGTDQGGGAVNDGIILRFPEYLDKILEIGKDYITVEPGALWSNVNGQLSDVGKFIPCYPASADFSTIGGAAANNCGGEKTVKYGSMRDYILELKIIIADGSEIEVKLLNQSEIALKQKQNNLEGGIYSKIAELLNSHQSLIEASQLKVNKSSTGYWLSNVLSASGIDLTKLICGSQGTLGIITEIKLKTLPRPAVTGLLLASFSDLEKAGSVVLDLLQLRPSALEMVDKLLIETLKKERSEILGDLFATADHNLKTRFTKERGETPAVVLFIEFDNDSIDEIKLKIEQAKKKLVGVAFDIRESYEPSEQERLWQIRRMAAVVAEGLKGAKKALPFIEDVTVHPSLFGQFLGDLYRIMEKHEVEFSLWGHAGNGNIHMQPLLDLADPADKEKLLAIADDVFKKVIESRGAISGEHNDGLLRSLYLKEQFGEPMYDLFKQVKNIFDPLNIFNPHKKTDADQEFSKSHLADEYLPPSF